MILECVFMLCYKFVSFSFEHLNILFDFLSHNSCHIGLWMDLKPILVCLARARKKTVHQIQNQILIQGLHCTMLTIEALFEHAKAKLSFQKEKWRPFFLFNRSLWEEVINSVFLASSLHSSVGPSSALSKSRRCSFDNFQSLCVLLCAHLVISLQHLMFIQSRTSFLPADCWPTQFHKTLHRGNPNKNEPRLRQEKKIGSVLKRTSHQAPVAVWGEWFPLPRNFSFFL